MREFEFDREDADELEDEPTPEVREFVIHSDDDIVEPVLDLPITTKKKRVYKPKIRKDSIPQQDEPIEIPERILREIEMLQDPIVELDERAPSPKPKPVKRKPPSPPPPSPPPEPVKAKKKEPLITCPNCSKEMLMKTFKYYHSLKCKPESEEVELPLEPKEEPKEQPKEEPVKELQAPINSKTHPKTGVLQETHPKRFLKEQ